MTATFLLDDIYCLLATPLGAGGWQVTFRSGHDGLHHQLYVDGELVSFTDTPGQRWFDLDATAAPRQILIAAVDAEHRATDLACLLPPVMRRPAWIYRANVIPPPGGAAGDRLEVLGDHATGQIDSRPLASMTLQPQWSPRWGFGRGRFGIEAMGYDAVDAPGLGGGAFGAGMFGADAKLVSLAVPLPEEGVHQLLLRVVAANGGQTSGDPLTAVSHPPPPPPRSIAATNYQAGVLTLAVTPES